MPDRLLLSHLPCCNHHILAMCPEPKHWEDDLFEIAIRSRETMEKIIGGQNL